MTIILCFLILLISFLFLVQSYNYQQYSLYKRINKINKISSSSSSSKVLLSKVLLSSSTSSSSSSIPIPSTSSTSTSTSSSTLSTTTSCNTCDDTCLTQKPLSSLLININDKITLNEIKDENIVNIVNLKYTDQECNVLAWKCLGYQYNKNIDKFELSNNVFPKWAIKYPEPPDLIGITRKYDPETDKVVRNASMDLMRSIPRSFKGGVRSLTNVGFKGYKLNELTPNKTRRAQLCNWIIYYREKLFGKTLEELKAEREKEAKESELPQEIKELPSEQWYQKNRLDDINN